MQAGPEIQARPWMVKFCKQPDSGYVEFAMYTHKSQVITFWKKSNLGIQQKKITNSLAINIWCYKQVLHGTSEFKE